MPPVTPDAGGVGLILKALEFAARKHRDQRRKDKRASPYINHPIQLATVLWEEGGVAGPGADRGAVRTDPNEDPGHLWQEPRGAVGDEVGHVVMEVTDVKWTKKSL